MEIDKIRLIKQLENKADEQKRISEYTAQSNQRYECKNNAEVINQAIEKIKKEW